MCLFDLAIGSNGILTEAKWLLDEGLLPNSNSATRAIGYRQVCHWNTFIYFYLCFIWIYFIIESRCVVLMFLVGDNHVNCLVFSSIFLPHLIRLISDLHSIFFLCIGTLVFIIWNAKTWINLFASFSERTLLINVQLNSNFSLLF